MITFNRCILLLYVYFFHTHCSILNTTRNQGHPKIVNNRSEESGLRERLNNQEKSFQSYKTLFRTLNNLTNNNKNKNLKQNEFEKKLADEMFSIKYASYDRDNTPYLPMLTKKHLPTLEIHQRWPMLRAYTLEYKANEHDLESTPYEPKIKGNVDIKDVKDFDKKQIKAIFNDPKIELKNLPSFGAKLCTCAHNDQTPCLRFCTGLESHKSISTPAIVTSTSKTDISTNGRCTRHDAHYTYQMLSTPPYYLPIYSLPVYVVDPDLEEEAKVTSSSETTQFEKDITSNHDPDDYYVDDENYYDEENERPTSPSKLIPNKAKHDITPNYQTTLGFMPVYPIPIMQNVLVPGHHKLNDFEIKDDLILDVDNKQEIIDDVVRDLKDYYPKLFKKCLCPNSVTNILTSSVLLYVCLCVLIL